MNIETFIKELKLDIQRSEKPFVDNMEHIGKQEDTFCGWIETFIAWMEWGEDCPETHIRYEDDK